MNGSCIDVSAPASKRPFPVTRRMAAWLAVAAAPTFAAMAIMTALAGGESMGAICGVEASPLAGMIPMYLLMSLFHASPWLDLIGHRWKRVRR
jgi:predicted Na+-dependent transporter